MFDKKSVSLEWAGRTLTIETGQVARQADGAVMVTYGDTKVLATACFAKSAKPGQDFFPLTVNYMEKYYASGRIPGGFFKREGRPTEKETLTSRLIDRPIRPLFVKGFKNEVQVVLTAMSYDLENDPDVIGMIGASAALVLSGAPFMGPIGAARVGYKDGEYIINPTIEELEESELDLVMAGTADAVMMVESEAYELSEEVMLGAVMAGHETTFPITLDQMIYHASSVIRAIDRALVVVDLPFGSYQSDPKEALRSAIRIMKESGAHAVKLEGGAEIKESVKRIHEYCKNKELLQY